MKKYVILYHSTVSAREQMSHATPEQAKAGMQAWMNWFDKNKKAVVEMGMPVERVAGVAKSGTSGTKSTISGYSVLQGDSLDSINKMLTDHPHLMAPANGSIEVFEGLCMPGM